MCPPPSHDSSSGNKDNCHAHVGAARGFRIAVRGPYLKFRPVQLPLGSLELETGPLVLDKVQDARHRVLRPLVLDVAVAAVVAAALVLVVGEGDVRAAGQLAVVILGRGAAAILHCGTTKLARHLHFMTRRPLQQLPFLRGVPRECSPVGQCISIGPSGKETIITHADVSYTVAVSPRPRANSCSPRSLVAASSAVLTSVRRSLPEKRKGPRLARGTVSSLLLRRPGCSSTGQRVKVAVRHASQWSREHLADRYARIATGNSPFLSAPTHRRIHSPPRRRRTRGPSPSGIARFVFSVPWCVTP